MRYKVVFVKFNELSSNDAQSRPDNNALIRNPESEPQHSENMIILKNQDDFVERKNAINKMVNNAETPEGIRENKQKETFQYQVPKIRASITLKVAPDSTTANLPESTVETANASNKENSSIIKNDSNVSSNNASLPVYGPHLPDTAYITSDKVIGESRPRIPAQASVIQSTPRAQRPSLANRSNHNITNDDKDFEIPLEESLKAVEDFIKREKELAKWHVGEDVLAIWKGNGLYYKAKILEIYPSGVIIVLFDSYDITEEIDYKDLRKFFKKSSQFKKKGRPQEKLKGDTEVKNKVCAKKRLKAKKRRRILRKSIQFISAFKRSDMLRKKLLLTYRKRSQNLPIIKSKPRA